MGAKGIGHFRYLYLVLIYEMTTLHFSFTEHILPCQYIREYPNAVKTDDAPLRLAIKEYRPLNIINAATDAVTIIAAHGNGFPKELYEPLFDDMWECMEGKIRSIWFADCSHQGASGVLNDLIQGDDRTYTEEQNPLICPTMHAHTAYFGYSELVRSFPGSAPYGEPLPK